MSPTAGATPGTDRPAPVIEHEGCVARGAPLVLCLCVLCLFVLCLFVLCLLVLCLPPMA